MESRLSDIVESWTVSEGATTADSGLLGTDQEVSTARADAARFSRTRP
jgi:hypothetical protein